MFGYITPFIPELKVRDKELYQSYYCGLCRALGKYGLGSKLSLTYDAAFAAVLLTSVTGREPGFERHACAMHPSRGKMATVAFDPIMDYCAAVCVLLAKYKLLDDAQDGRPLRKAALPVLAGGIRRAEKNYPEAAKVLDEGLKRLAEIEKPDPADPDSAPLLFGGVLGELLCACPEIDEEVKPVLMELGRKLGGFVYVTDAWDDREEDEKRGSYNMFRLVSFPDMKEACAAMLDMYINSAVLAYDLLDLKTAKPLLDNIMYIGLGARAAEVLNGGSKRRKEAEQTDAEGCPGDDPDGAEEVKE